MSLDGQAGCGGAKVKGEGRWQTGKGEVKRGEKKKTDNRERVSRGQTRKERSSKRDK